MRYAWVRWLSVFAVVVVATGGGRLYDQTIGFPRKIAAPWAKPHVTWYWTGSPPLGYPFPAIVRR